MSGCLCNGQPDLTAGKIKNSKSYCEGRESARTGGAPNPHVTGSEASDSWRAGYDSWFADPQTGVGQDCCASPYGGGYVPPP